MGVVIEMIYKKIKDLNLEKLEGFQSWCYNGDSYKDKQGNMYCVVDSEENEEEIEVFNISKGKHLYKVETGEIEFDVNLILVV